MTKAAVVEDSLTLRKYLANLIGRTPGHKCICTCEPAEQAVLEIPKRRPDVVLMDIHLSGESGIACTARLKEQMPGLQTIVLTVYKGIRSIFQALKAGARGYPLKRADQSKILEAIAAIRAGGAAMTGEVARMVVHAFAESPQKAPAARGMDQLSDREMEILALVAEGCSNKEIASRVLLCSSTVRAHLMHIHQKLQVHSRTEVATKYLRLGH